MTAENGEVKLPCKGAAQSQFAAMGKISLYLTPNSVGKTSLEEPELTLIIGGNNYGCITVEVSISL